MCVKPCDLVIIFQPQSLLNIAVSCFSATVAAGHHFRKQKEPMHRASEVVLA